MNICRNLESVERWFDGELNDAGDFEAHLAGCSDCTDRLEELKLLRAAAVPAQQMPEIADAQFPAFMQRIREETEAPRRLPVGRWAIASGLAAAVIVALSLISIVSPGPEPLQAVTIEESSTDIDGATTEVFINEETTMVWINLPDGDML